MTIDWFNRTALFIGGLLGAAGMAAAAAATHSGGAYLDQIALVALTQAPLLVSFGLATITSLSLRIGAVVVGVGALLFIGDLAARSFGGFSLFPNAAPTGGSAMIIGWAIIAVSGLFLKSRPSA